MDLRDYQSETISGAREAYKASENPVLVLPTGGGKTFVGATMISRLVANGRRVLWIAHLKELLEQAEGAMKRQNLRCGYVAAGYPADADAPVQIASIQTLARRTLPSVDIVFVDEAHHVRSRTYGRVLAHYRQAGAWIVGLTATPQRLDGRGLGKHFDRIVEKVTTRELIDRGHLSSFKYFAPSTPDLSDVGTVAGDYNQGQVAKAMNKSKITGDIVAHFIRHAKTLKTLVFAAGVGHSLALVEAFKRAGFVAAHLDGTTPAQERKEVFQAFREGRIQILSNAALFFEGVDVPDVGCVILARPTKSLTIHRQSVGRGLRAAPGKAHCLILDHAGNYERLGLPDSITEWSLEDKEKKQTAKSHKRCPQCFAVLPAHAQTCDECGYVFTRTPRQGPQNVKGELEEVKVHVFTAEEKRSLYDHYLGVAEACGHKRGWASRQYRLRTRVWPRGFADLVESWNKKCRHIRSEIDERDGQRKCRFCGAAT